MTEENILSISIMLLIVDHKVWGNELKDDPNNYKVDNFNQNIDKEVVS